MTVRHQNAAHQKARQSAPSPQHTQGRHSGQPAAYKGKANENASQSPYAGQPDQRSYEDRDGNSAGAPRAKQGASDVKEGKTELPQEREEKSRIRNTTVQGSAASRSAGAKGSTGKPRKEGRR